MIAALILVPALAAVAAFFIRSHTLRRGLLLGAALAHAGLTAAAWYRYQSAPDSAAGSSALDPDGGKFLVFDLAFLRDYLALDALGLLFLTVTSGLFLVCMIYAVGYLRREEISHHQDYEEGVFFSNVPEATFTACLLAFLSTMTLVIASRHFGLQWVAVEATTLASAPLIYFHRHHRSLEATWKYLLICSVGIALALLGNFFLVVAASTHEPAAGGPTPATQAAPALSSVATGAASSADSTLAPGVAAAAATNPAANSRTKRSVVTTMTFSEFAIHAPEVNVRWLQAAFLLLLVGYGTKMGLAPLHTWLPDAHSEAPSVVSALLSGALLNCAFLAILRVHAVCVAAGQAAFSQDLLILFGLVSMAVAGVFILAQADFKRLLAYSSVEHMGILALGVGIGGAAAFGSMLHTVNHSLTKGLLFLVAGNILAAYRTKSTADVRGVLRVLPVSGVLWLAGFLAITGSPPFGPFMSELAILNGAFQQGHPWVATIYLALLVIIFVAMATVVLRMAQGAPPDRLQAQPADGSGRGEDALAVLPPALLLAVVLVLGLYIPGPLTSLLQEAARLVGVPQ